MKKMNNKGLTIVELIVTFGLLMILIVGLLEIVLEAKSDVTDKRFMKDMNEFKSILTKTIQDDFIMAGVSSANCSGSSCDITVGGVSKTLRVDGKVITYDGMKYEFPHSKDIEVKDVSMGVKNNILEISIPCYRVHSSKNTSEVLRNYNYGIKIIHPLN